MKIAVDMTPLFSALVPGLYGMCVPRSVCQRTPDPGP